MQLETVVSVLCAAHYTFAVESPWQERGGLLFVASPGHMKTTVIDILQQYPHVYLSTDLNSQMLANLRDQISGGMIRTVAIPDLAKLYERHPMVSANLEGSLRALMEEGYIASSYQDASVVARRSRALVIAGATPSLRQDKSLHWKKSGFDRRLLISTYALREPAKLIDCVELWRKIEVKNGMMFHVPLQSIPYTVTSVEAKQLRHWLRASLHTTPFQLLSKIACVLRWRFRQAHIKDATFAIMEDFSESLIGEGALVDL